MSADNFNINNLFSDISDHAFDIFRIPRCHARLNFGDVDLTADGVLTILL